MIPGWVRLWATRIYPYANREEALNDALRLSKAMTYKSALAENGFGGGKSVSIADPKKDKTPQLLQSFAEVLNTLGGQYIAAEDVGSTVDDMVIVHTRTPFVGALPTENSWRSRPFYCMGRLSRHACRRKRLWKNP